MQSNHPFRVFVENKSCSLVFEVVNRQIGAKESVSQDVEAIVGTWEPKDTVVVAILLISNEVILWRDIEIKVVSELEFEVL